MTSQVLEPCLSTLPSPRLALVPEPARLDVLGQALPVALTSGERVDYANFDYAASAPCLAAVADAVSRALPEYASAHRGAGSLSVKTTQRYEEARATVAGFLGCRDDDAVVFTRNTTDATNLLAHVLPVGTRVVVFGSEHHATLLPWSDAVRLPIPATSGEAVRSVHDALRELRRDGDQRPILVAVTGASNVTGELWPSAEIAVVARRHRARVFLDAAQLAPHRAVDVAALGVDYVAVSGHKLYAPFGSGVLAGRTDWLDAASPYLSGGGASRHVGDATDDIEWATGPARHEAGTPNVIGAVALAAACRALSTAGQDRLADAEASLLKRLRDGLRRIPGLHELTAFGPAAPRVGIVAFTVDGIDAATLAQRLSDEYGIGVRAGLFCAHPLTRRLLNQSGGTGTTAAVRASIGLGSTPEHVDRLVAAVSKIAAER